MHLNEEATVSWTEINLGATPPGGRTVCSF
jgi:hypothetical protein